MPRMTDMILVDANTQPALVIRETTSIDRLPKVIGDSYGKLEAYMEEMGVLPSGVPFIAYHNMDMQNLEVEIGFPLKDLLPEKNELKLGSIPGGLRVFCMYRGAYDKMEETYGEMSRWIGENGFVPAGPVYEEYYNDPGFPEDQLLTRIVMLIEKNE